MSCRECQKYRTTIVEQRRWLFRAARVAVQTSRPTHVTAAASAKAQLKDSESKFGEHVTAAH